MKGKVLITGGLGFQGTHLSVELIKNGYKVFAINTPSVHAQRNLKWLEKTVGKECIDNKTFEHVWGSITDKHVMERLVPQVDIVFHLAAKVNVDESIELPDTTFETNIFGTYQILNFALKNNTRVIMASTCEVYGGGHQLDEYSLLNPQSPYGASKASADRIGYSYNCTYKLPVDIVRPFNVYGPLQKEGGRGAVISIFFKKIMNGEQLQIHGDGEQKRDFIFIEDVIRGYMGILNTENKDTCNIYTFGTGISSSVNDLVTHIGKITDVTPNAIHVEARKGQVSDFIAKNSVNDYFGGKNMITFYEGLKKYYEFRFKDENSLYV